MPEHVKTATYPLSTFKCLKVGLYKGLDVGLGHGQDAGSEEDLGG